MYMEIHEARFNELGSIAVVQFNERSNFKATASALATRQIFARARIHTHHFTFANK